MNIAVEDRQAGRQTAKQKDGLSQWLKLVTHYHIRGHSKEGEEELGELFPAHVTSRQNPASQDHQVQQQLFHHQHPCVRAKPQWDVQLSTSAKVSYR